MKKTLLLVLLAACGLTAAAQTRELQPLHTTVAPAAAITPTHGLTGMSTLLLAELESGTDRVELAVRYHLSGTASQLIVNAFVEMEAGHSVQELEVYGVGVKRTLGRTHCVTVPLDRYAALARSGLCSLIDIGAPERPTLDKARAATSVDMLYAGTGLSQKYDGSGVVVGVVDNGFEYGHTAFYDSTGSTLRVKRAWNENTYTGTSPSGYGYGAEYTTASAMLAAKYDDSEQTHGTHVAGIAAGCGGKTASGKKYRGVAPAADIVLVSTNRSSAGTFDGITYVVDYAQSVDKPCAINLSLGSHVGPHDGTSSFDRVCDELLDGTQGIVLVGAAGNEGADNLHVSKTFSTSDSLLYVLLDFDGNQYGSSVVDIWGAPNKSFMAAVGIVDVSTGTFEDASYYYLSNTTGYDNENLSDAVSFIVAQNGTYTYNERQNITFSIDATALPSGYRAILVVKSTVAQTLHVWGNTCTFVDEGFSAISAGNTDYTVGEVGGVGNSMLTVGSYTTATSWDNNLTGYSYSIGGTVGALSGFSSHGPSLDNRVKPDVLAPGQILVAPINGYNSSYVNSAFGAASTSVGGTTYYYGAMQGTSMATPFVTGVVALWLQDNPTMSYSEAIGTAHSTALTDGYTGTIPATGSNLYGWGKINATGNIGTTSSTEYSVTVTTNKSAYGTAGGSGTVGAGGTATLTANAKSGHHFLYWADNHSTANPRTVTVSKDTTIMAVFGIDDQANVNNQCVITSFPYETHMDSEVDCWILQDANSDGKTWFFIYDYGVDQTPCVAVEGAADCEEYLASPLIEKSGTYTVGWKARAFNSNYGESYGVYIYDEQQNPVVFNESLTSTAYVSRTANFTVKQGTPVRVLFNYVSNNKAGMLIDDITITRTGDVGIDDVAGDGLSITVEDLTMHIGGAAGEPVNVSDVSGRTLHSGVATDDVQVELPAAGVYFVRVGDRPARKVVAVR